MGKHDEDTKGFVWSDAADTFAAQNPDMRYWNGEWYWWSGGIYEQVATEEVEDFVLQWLIRGGITDKPLERNAVMSCLRAVARVHAPDVPCWINTPTDAVPFRSDNRMRINISEYLLTFSDGRTARVKDIMNGEPAMRPSDRNWFALNKMPFQYDPTATCPVWDRTLDTILPDPSSQACLDEWFGYACVPDVRYHKALFMVGTGANGKSTVSELLQHMVSVENCSNIPLENFGQRFALAGTRGKLLNACDETVWPRNLERSIKWYITGSRITCDRKNKEPVSFNPTARLVIAMNEPPRGADPTSGLWRRILMLPFNVSIPEQLQDRTLIDKLLNELPGIFNRSMRGLKRLLVNDRFTDITAGLRLVRRLRTEANPASEFARIGLVRDADGFVSNTDLLARYKEFLAWCGLSLLSAGERKIKSAIQLVYPDVNTNSRCGPKSGVKGIRMLTIDEITNAQEKET